MRLLDVSWLRVLGTATIGVALAWVFAEIGMDEMGIVPGALIAGFLVGLYPQEETDKIYEGGWSAGFAAFVWLGGLPIASLLLGYVHDGFSTQIVIGSILFSLVGMPFAAVGGAIAALVGAFVGKRVF